MPLHGGDRGAQLLYGLLHACLPHDSQNRYLAVLQAYADLSGTEKHRMYVAGCYLATEECWTGVDAQWKHALDWAEVDHFHATDFFTCGGAFAGWTPGSRKHKKAERRFLSIAANSGLRAIVAGVETAAFSEDIREALRSVKPKYRLSSLRLVNAQMCFHAVSESVLELAPSPDDRALIVFEAERGMGEVEAYFRVMEKRNDVAWTRNIQGVTQEPKRKLRPLQVADLLAYLSFHYLTHWASAGRRAKPDPRFMTLIRNQGLMLRVQNRQSVEALLPRVRAFLQANPSGFGDFPDTGA